MTEFGGTLYDGLTTARVAVRVTARGHDIVVDDGASPPRAIARGDVAVDTPVPGVPRMIRLPGGEAIETPDHAAVAQIWPSPSAIARIAHTLESQWSSALASLGVTAALAWLVVAYVLPFAAEPVSHMVSANVDRAMGEQVLDSLDRTIMRPSELGEERQLDLLDKFTTYIATEPSASSYRLELRRAGTPNALALPGGIVIVTDEMVDAVASDEELYAVIAHELGHQHRRHALRLVLQNSGVAVLMTALAGDAVGVTVLAAAMPTVLVQTSYSRRFETEADDYAFESLKRHGISPGTFADLMRRLRKQHEAHGREESLIRYLSTHPATDERIRRAEQAR
jgi:predicted Zn-dependent protease